jgi:hypothetical protein
MILRWENGKYYPVEHGTRVASEERPLGEETPSHRHIINRLRAFCSDGLQLNGTSIYFGMQPEGRYNPYLDMTAVPRIASGLSLSHARLRTGSIVILIGQDKAAVPGHVIQQGRRVSIELPWEEKKGKRFYVLDEGGSGIITVTLACDGSDKIRAVCPASLSSWLSSECPTTAPQYSLESNGSLIRCPDGRMLESEDGRKFSSDDLSLLNRSGLVGMLGKYRLRRVRQCQG